MFKVCFRNEKSQLKKAWDGIAVAKLKSVQNCWYLFSKPTVYICSSKICKSARCQLLGNWATLEHSHSWCLFCCLHWCRCFRCVYVSVFVRWARNLFALNPVSQLVEHSYVVAKMPIQAHTCKLSCVTTSDWPHLSHISAVGSTLSAPLCFRVTGWVNVSMCTGASILCSITTECVRLEDTTTLITHPPVHCVHLSMPAFFSWSPKTTWCVCKKPAWSLLPLRGSGALHKQMREV